MQLVGKGMAQTHPDVFNRVLAEMEHNSMKAFGRAGRHATQPPPSQQHRQQRPTSATPGGASKPAQDADPAPDKGMGKQVSFSSNPPTPQGGPSPAKGKPVSTTTSPAPSPKHSGAKESEPQEEEENGRRASGGNTRYRRAVVLHKENNGLGLKIQGGLMADGAQMPVVVCQVFEGGAAHRAGVICVGDRLVFCFVWGVGGGG